MKNKAKIQNKEHFKNGNQKKKHGFWFYFLNAFIWSIVGFLTIFSALEFADKKTGFKVLPTHTAVIVSDSMSKVHPDNVSYITSEMTQINKGDIVRAKEYKNYSDVDLYDVILYTGQDGSLICHRVVELYENEGKQWVVTRGDANGINDVPVSFEIVRGKVVNTIKGVGKIIMFMQTPYFLIGVFGSGFFIFLGFFIAGYSKKNKNSKDFGTKKQKKPISTSSSKMISFLFITTGIVCSIMGVSNASAIYKKGVNSANFAIGAESVDENYYVNVYDSTGTYVNRSVLTVNPGNNDEMMIQNLQLYKGYKIIGNIPSTSTNFGGTYSHNIAVTCSDSSGTTDGNYYIAVQDGTYDVYFKFTDSTHTSYTSAYVNVDDVTVLYIQNKKSDDWAGIRYWGDDVINSPSDYYYANDQVTQWDGKNTFRYYVPSHATGFKVRNGWYESCDLSLTTVQNNNTHAIWFDNNNGGYNGWTP